MQPWSNAQGIDLLSRMMGVELLISRLSIECFEPAKLLRNGAEKRNRTADLLRTWQALFQLSYFGVESGADGRTRTCDELGVEEPIEPLG